MTVFSQNLGIAEVVVYKKLNDKWDARGKNIYSIESGIEKQIRYKWENNHWQLTIEFIRNISSNSDTVRAKTIHWKEGVKTDEYEKVCYNQRSNENTIEDVIIDNESKIESMKYFRGHYNINIDEECFRINYPFDNVMREAEKLRQDGIELNGRKLEYEMCNYELFSISSDNLNRPNILESELSRVEIRYKESDETELNSDLQFEFYPNPFESILTIKILADEVETLEIINSQGKRIDYINVRGEKSIKTNLSYVPAGIYFVYMTSKNKVFTQKLIKK